MPYKDPEQRRKCAKEYRQRPEVKKRTKMWKSRSPEKIREYNKTYRSKHPNLNRIAIRKWRLKHPDINRSANSLAHKNWKLKNQNLYKTLQKKHKAKRRKLGFIPLNKPFVGSVAHHIDKNFVVYVPEPLHISIPHNVWTGKNMGVINERAWAFLGKV